VYRTKINPLYLNEAYLSKVMSPGDIISVRGYLWGPNNTNIDAKYIEINDEKILETNEADSEENSIVIGEVIGFHMPVDNIGIAQNDDAKKAVKAYFNGYVDIKYDDNFHAFNQTNTQTNRDDAVFVYAINDVASRYYKVFAIVDQTPILEATNAISNFYPYFLSLAIVLAVLISMFMTRLVSDPLVALNNSAKRMADFDFNQFITVKRKDEIGSLATSLNTLSFNLKKNMDELETKNKSLIEDIERERHIEKMRKDFISSASHELKTPLGIIRGFSEGIKDGIAEVDELDYYIDVILEEVDKMDMLVLDMLELSKMQREVKRIRLEEFDFVALLDDLLLRFSPQFSELEINVVKNYTELPIEVEADYTKVEQVLKNLISNACRYGTSSSDLYVGIQQVNDEVFFSIENKAEPIPEDKISHIWDKFYRVDDARQREIGGTGLGLAIVREILESHQWKYGVKNTDYGVQFYFYFKAKTE